MIFRKPFVALGLVAGLLAGCGDDSYDGSYLTDPSEELWPVMNVDGDRAVFVIVNRHTAEFKEAGKFAVSYEDQNMVLDEEGGGQRFVYGRGFGSRALRCLNCEDDSRIPMPTKWMASKTHFELDEALEEQREEDMARLKQQVEGAETAVQSEKEA